MKQLAANHSNVDIIEHYNLSDQNGFLNPSFGRFKKGRYQILMILYTLGTMV